ncbi:MAG: NAD(P)/FAD-dependent oxidoreductase [Armatimonadetes bacterium]|nr:NAD(P)/FAD-dependent oxidoreductase [Armatimonadota bacterium]
MSQSETGDHYVTYDAIIIGAGHNGLVCAAYLAKAGKKVIVLERRDIVGGAAVTEEIFPGYKCSRASYVNSLFRPKIIRDLELKSFGLEFIPRQPASFSPFPDGSHLMLGADMQENQKEIAKFSTKDAEAYPKYEAMLDRIVSFVEPTWDQPPPSAMSGKPGDVLSLAKMGMKAKKLGPGFLQDTADVFTLSAADFLDRWFESEALKSTLVTDGVIGAMAGPYSPGTAYVLLHHVMGETDGVRGVWAYVRGGMGGLSDSIAAACRSLGVEIKTGSPVARIITENGAAVGVVLDSGEDYRARCVVSTVDLHMTFVRLMSADQLPEDFLAAVKNIDYKSGTAKMNLALSELPDFIAAPGKTVGPQHKGTIHISPTVEYLERAFDDCKYGWYSQNPMLECTIQSAVDDSLTPDGKHVMSIFCQYAPYSLKDADWADEKENFANRIIDVMTEFAPNFRDSVEGYELLTPADIESIFGLRGGNIFQGSMSLNQLFFMRPVAGWSDHRTPIKNLFIAGSAAHPGGGVTGAPGHNASRVILKCI